MSVRNLDALFRPRSVALVGASDRPGSVGAVVLHNLKAGGFEGPIWPVNARHPTVGGGRAWPDIGSLPEAPDLAVICTPAAAVPRLMPSSARKERARPSC
jgi:acetyltransferase